MNTNSDSDLEIVDVVKDKIQNVLNRVHKEPAKRKIDVFRDRFNFACPICGDSVGDRHKKRGNLYFNSMSYHCYNCGYHAGVNSLLRRFDEGLSGEDRIAVATIQQSAKKLEKRSSSSQSSMAFNLLEKMAIPKSILFKVLNLTTPFKSEDCADYLKGRKIDIRKWKHFAYAEQTKELYILNITQSDRVIGFQIRQLDKNSKKSRYKTSDISAIYNDLFKRDTNVIVESLLSKEELGSKYIEAEDGIENIVFNLDRLSGLFNVMNADLSRTLTIVEGPIDSLAIDNCIALQGATKMNDYFDNVESVRYLFDNDKAGKDVTLKKLKAHKQVFLWEQYLKTEGLKTKIKDVNDLQKAGNINWETFDKCFSDDELDVMMI